MLDAIRKMAKGWVAMILIGLLVMSFALWGVADVFTGYGSNTVASVGDRDVGYRDFQRAYDSAMRNFNRRLGTPLTNQQAVAFGIPNQVIGQLTTEATIEEIADDLGLGVSEENLAILIQTDPSLRGVNGQFDRTALQYTLGQLGMSENEFVVDRKKSALRAQLADGLVGEMTVPSAYMEAINAYQNEQRSTDYAVISSTDLENLADPTATELRTFFDKDKSAFKAPEYRSFELLVLQPDTVSDPASVTDEDAQAEYEQVKDTRYGAPERRNFQQLLFANKTAAQAASDKIEGGASFEDIVTAENKDLGDIQFGLKSKSEIIDKAIAEAVFALPANGISKVVEGRFGNFVLRVTDIREEAVLPFAEVKEQIKRDVAARNAESEVFRLYDEIEDARAGGSTLKEISDKFKVAVQSLSKIDSEGNGADGTAAALPEQSTVLTEVFRTDVGEEADPVQLGRTGFSWFDVTDIVPESDRSFEDAKDLITAAWRADKQKTRLDDKAAEIIAAVKAGRSLEGLMTPMGIEVKKADEITRSATPEGLPASLATAVFDGPDGHAGSAAGEDADQRIIYKVTSASEPAYFEEAEGNAETRQQFSTALQQTVLRQYVQKVQSDLGVTVNNQAVGYILGLYGDNPQHQGTMR